MKFPNLATALLLLGAALSSCASKDLNRSLDEKVGRENAINSRQDLEAKANSMVANTPGLSEEQRLRIGAIQTRLRARLKELAAESLKLRALLIQDVLASGENSREINAVKGKLRGNSWARIDAIFGAIDEANDALGRSRLIREAMDLQMLDDQIRY